MKGELRRGLAATAPYLLSHHETAERHHCHRVRIFDRQLFLCARCSGLYPGLFAAILAPISVWPLAVIGFLPLPALVDWTVTRFTGSRSNNYIRTLTGFLLGYGYGLGLVRLVTAGDYRVLAVGVLYGVTAVALLSAKRRREK
jgi:uncharacterized membrane protein